MPGRRAGVPRPPGPSRRLLAPAPGAWGGDASLPSRSALQVWCRTDQGVPRRVADRRLGLSRRGTAMSGLTDVRVVRVPRDFALQAHAHLQRVGTRGLEGFAVWAGSRDGDV